MITQISDIALKTLREQRSGKRAPRSRSTSCAKTNANTRVMKSSQNSKASNVLKTPLKESKESIDIATTEVRGADESAFAAGAVIVPAVIAPPLMAPEMLTTPERLNAQATLERRNVPVMPKNPRVLSPYSRSRHIPSSIRRGVFKRDGLACTYQGPISGRRCGSRFALELDHRIPFAKGGLHSADNLTARCRGHNQWAAQLIFGLKKMARYARYRRTL